VEGPGRLALVERPAPEPGPGEALVDVRVAGICGTDLQLARGYMGFHGIPGHEFVGTVTGVTAPADRVLIGARVVGEINLGCQDCQRCAEGMVRHCPRRRVLGILNKDGAFAQQLTLPVSNLHALPDSLPDEEAVFAEPLAAAFEILDQLVIDASDRVLVLGGGRLGLLVGQVLAGGGADVTVAGRSDSSLGIARSLGLTAVRAPDGISAAPFDVVVETTGSPEGLDQAVARVRPRGTVVMKSTCAGAAPFSAARVVVDEITILGSRCGRMEPALAALRAGSVSVKGMVRDVVPLEEGAEGLRRAGLPGALKVLLRVAR
jgi:threonine dehydrogenase-like Zn-dependent dehydrogenase